MRVILYYPRTSFHAFTWKWSLLLNKTKKTGCYIQQQYLKHNMCFNTRMELGDRLSVMSYSAYATTRTGTLWRKLTNYNVIQCKSRKRYGDLFCEQANNVEAFGQTIYIKDKCKTISRWKTLLELTNLFNLVLRTPLRALKRSNRHTSKLKG